MKDSTTRYFPHDENAYNDPKCAALLHDHGMAGYGFYWILIELLHRQRGGKLEKFPKLFEGLARQFLCEKEFVTKQIEALLHEYFLLQEDEKYIWSNRVSRNLEKIEEKRLIKVEAGRIGGIKSGESRRYNNSSKKTSKQTEADRSRTSSKTKQTKQIKLNKSKEDIESDSVIVLTETTSIKDLAAKEKMNGSSSLCEQKIKQFANGAWKNQIWKESMLVGFKIKSEQLERWMGLFNGSLISNPIDDLTDKRYMSACRGWIQKQIANGHKVDHVEKKSDAPPLTTIIHKPKNEDE